MYFVSVRRRFQIERVAVDGQPGQRSRRLPEGLRRQSAIGRSHLARNGRQRRPVQPQPVPGAPPGNICTKKTLGYQWTKLDMNGLSEFKVQVIGE